MKGHILRGTCSALFAVIAAIATAQTGHPWSQQGAGPERTGQSSYPGPTAGTVAWSQVLSGQSPGLAINSLGQIATGVIYNNAWWSQGVYASVYRHNGKLNHRAKVEPYPWGYKQNTLATPAWTPNGALISRIDERRVAEDEET